MGQPVAYRTERVCPENQAARAFAETALIGGFVSCQAPGLMKSLTIAHPNERLMRMGYVSAIPHRATGGRHVSNAVQGTISNDDFRPAALL